jgi:hypothetical protein
MTAQQLAALGLEALDAGVAPVQFLMRDGALFSGPLTYVCDEYAILGGLGFPVAQIARAELLALDDAGQRGRHVRRRG